jgi:hypothetical protein
VLECSLRPRLPRRVLDLASGPAAACSGTLTVRARRGPLVVTRHTRLFPVSQGSGVCPPPLSASSACVRCARVQVCLGGPALAHICDALCWNHKHFTGGLPDLLLWRVWAPPPHPSAIDCAVATGCATVISGCANADPWASVGASPAEAFSVAEGLEASSPGAAGERAMWPSRGPPCELFR